MRMSAEHWVVHSYGVHCVGQENKSRSTVGLHDHDGTTTTVGNRLRLDSRAVQQ